MYRRNKKASDGSRPLSSSKVNERNDLDTESNRNSPHITVPHPADESYKIIISNSKNKTHPRSGLAIVDLDSTQHPIDQQPTSLFTDSISHQETSKRPLTNPKPLPHVPKVSFSNPNQRSSQPNQTPEDLFFGRSPSSIQNSRIQSIKRGNVNIPLDDYNL